MSPALAALLLKGHPGNEGFLFHDGCNQQVHQAAPGVLGLLEGRRVIKRWKPEILSWMDEHGHFFNHILKEYSEEPDFESIRREIEEIRDMDTSIPDKSRSLFSYLELLAGELERTDMAFPPGDRSERDRRDLRSSGNLSTSP